MHAIPNARMNVPMSSKMKILIISLLPNTEEFSGLSTTSEWSNLSDIFDIPVLNLEFIIINSPQTMHTYTE